jgi:hypothetical protein
MLFPLVVEIENSKLRILPVTDDSFNCLITYMPILNILVVSYKDASESVSRHAYVSLLFLWCCRPKRVQTAFSGGF